MTTHINPFIGYSTNNSVSLCNLIDPVLMAKLYKKTK